MLNLFLYPITFSCRCDEETIDSEPTDEDYSHEDDEDADASYENYTDKQTDHDLHVRSDLQNSPHSSTNTPTTTTTTETFSDPMIAEPKIIHDKGKLGINQSIYIYICFEKNNIYNRIFYRFSMSRNMSMHRQFQISQLLPTTTS